MQKTDPDIVVERLLTITGEDGIDVNRKNRPHWSGQLRVRFVIISNEAPRLADAAGALAGRFIVLRIVPSFYGRENLNLTEELLAELPGILLWAIAGYHRLIKRGHFVQPASAEDDVETMEDVGSPVATFVKAKLETGGPETGGPETHEAVADDVYKTWVTWCEEHRQHAGTTAVFGRDLKTVLPKLKIERRRDASITDRDERIRIYRGIRIKPAPQRSSTDFNNASKQWTK